MAAASSFTADEVVTQLQIYADFDSENGLFDEDSDDEYLLSDNNIDDDDMDDSFTRMHLTMCLVIIVTVIQIKMAVMKV